MKGWQKKKRKKVEPEKVEKKKALVKTVGEVSACFES
jgi:hypothetical protein